jgi:hypothetical protein
LDEVWVTTVQNTYEADRFFPMDKVHAAFPGGPILETYFKTPDDIKYTIACFKR